MLRQLCSVLLQIREIRGHFGFRSPGRNHTGALRVQVPRKKPHGGSSGAGPPEETTRGLFGFRSPGRNHRGLCECRQTAQLTDRPPPYLPKTSTLNWFSAHRWNSRLAPSTHHPYLEAGMCIRTQGLACHPSCTCTHPPSCTRRNLRGKFGIRDSRLLTLHCARFGI